MDPVSINRFGQVRHQEIVEWGTQRAQQEPRPVFAAFTRLWSRLSQKLNQPAHSPAPSMFIDCEGCPSPSAE